MIFAQVLNGMIVNVIMVSNVSVLPKLSYALGTNLKYDCVTRVDKLKPQPGIGWKTNCNGKFTPPRPPKGY